MSNDLIAKTAIDRRLAEILIPVIEDMGFELVRLRLQGGKTATLQRVGKAAPEAVNEHDCALWTMTRCSSPFVAPETISRAARSPPEDCPSRVTQPGSPPKSAM